MKKFLATIALAATAMIGLAGTASADVRHSDYVVQVGGTWITEDALTPANLAELASTCQPVQFAVVVHFTSANGVAGTVQIPLASATKAVLNEANGDQAGLTIPSFIGPDHHYTVTYSPDGAPVYGC